MNTSIIPEITIEALHKEISSSFQPRDDINWDQLNRLYFQTVRMLAKRDPAEAALRCDISRATALLIGGASDFELERLISSKLMSFRPVLSLRHMEGILKDDKDSTENIASQRRVACHLSGDEEYEQ